MSRATERPEFPPAVKAGSRVRVQLDGKWELGTVAVAKWEDGGWTYLVRSGSFDGVRQFRQGIRLARTQATSSYEESHQRFTVHLPEALVDQARDAVVALADESGLTLAQLTETALRAELRRLWRKHNSAKPFPRRERELKRGRPPKLPPSSSGSD